MRLGIGELLRKAREINDVEERIAFMRRHYSAPIGNMLKYALEPEFVWDLPPGIPPYKENQFMDQHSNLYSEIRRMYLFMKGSGDHVAPVRKELLFIQLLENVDPEDAKFLVHAKEKTLPHQFTVEEIHEIYPGLLSENAGTAKDPDLTVMTDEELGKDVPLKRRAGRPKGSKNKPKAAKSGTGKATKKALTKKPVVKKEKVGENE